MKNYIFAVLLIIVLFIAVWGAGIIMTHYPLMSIVSIVVVAIGVSIFKKVIFAGGSAFSQLKDRVKKYKTFNQQEEKDKIRMLKLMGSHPDILKRSNINYHFTASAWIINESKTKVLMVHHNIFNSWSWVGGHADGSTELLEVALRETAEETGLTKLEVLSENIFSLEILGVQGHMKNREYVPAHLHLNLTYLFQADESDKLKIKDDENSDVQWIEISKIPEMCNEPMMLPIYNKLIVKAQSINTIDIAQKRMVESQDPDSVMKPDAFINFEQKASDERYASANDEAAARQIDAQRAEVLRDIIKKSSAS